MDTPLPFDGFDSYSVSSDASAPHTPSPRASLPLDDMPFHDPHSKHHVRFDFPDHPHKDSPDDPHPAWGGPTHPSLLQELYTDQDHPHHPAPQVYNPDGAFAVPHDWSHSILAHDQPRFAHPHLIHDDHAGLVRRASFPFVHRDHPPHGHGPVYAEPLPMHPHHPHHPHHHHQPLAADPSQLHAHHPPPRGLDDSFMPSSVASSSPHTTYHEFDETAGIKLEDASPMIVPSHHNSFFRPAPPGTACSPHTISYMSQVQVQHTDDASSKETQFLRRRCYNCHTTEPPSWRRSTLNPGKIVCNKCGLYERTHLRPRPPRFDELRAGKTRKQPKTGGSLSPKSKASVPGMIKKEAADFVFESSSRRGSVSSGSSVSGQSDWDDTVSMYSSGSAPPSIYNSPNPGAYPSPRVDSNSPPLPPPSRDGPIRLPNAPLSDIASLTSSPSSHHELLSSSPSMAPRKAATSPGAYYGVNGGSPHMLPQPFYAPGIGQQRRGSLPMDMPMMQRRHTTIGMPEVTGWQTVPLTELVPSARGMGDKLSPMPPTAASVQAAAA